jgi:deoxyribodipyrimidine photo-lyase
MTTNTVIMWFRQDLRLNDNPALHAAIAQGCVLPVYVLDDPRDWARGSASRWWLHHSLYSLNQSLQGKLWILQGDATKVIAEFAADHGASQVVWNRCYEPGRIHADSLIKQQLNERGIAATSFNGGLLWEPWQNLKQDGSPYKVFTPYYKKAISSDSFRPAVKAPLSDFDLLSCEQVSDRIEQLGLLPKINWYKEIASTWSPGEVGAQQRLQSFINSKIDGYRDARDYPAKRNVSMLSPHLHFGEISPNQAALAATQAGRMNGVENQAEHFVRELAWREYSYYSLYHFPQLCQQNMKPKFDRFPWINDEEKLRLWQQGLTGYPLVDAGMRELWNTGYMHNRVRMIVGSFLVKNLMIHWQRGAQWFWDCLVDADLANNSCSWQWVAGSGADAAPYFRIFNPLTQSRKFDPSGAYIRRFVPELKGLSDKAIHDPSSATKDELLAAGIVLGQDYPKAIIDLKESRERALEAYKSITD